MNPQPDNAATHPSFLALDRAHLGHASTEVLSHLDVCEDCRRYVESPGTAASASGFAALEQRIEQRERSRESSRSFRSARLWGGLSLAAAACGVALFVGLRNPGAPGSEGGYVGAKGFRSVWIYVKRGSDTQLWDGRRPLVAGDRVRLKVDPGSFHHVAVYAADEPRAPSLLFSGLLTPGQNLTLPDAWEIDDSDVPEQLFVVFSDRLVEPNWDEWKQGKAAAEIAVLPFVLPKAGAADIDAGSRGL